LLAQGHSKLRGKKRTSDTRNKKDKKRQKRQNSPGFRIPASQFAAASTAQDNVKITTTTTTTTTKPKTEEGKKELGFASGLASARDPSTEDVSVVWSGQQIRRKKRKKKETRSLNLSLIWLYFARVICISSLGSP